MAAMERQGMSGTLTLVLRDAAGQVVDRREIKNVITKSGKNLMAQYFTGMLQALPLLSIAVGSDGDTAAAESNTKLTGYLEEVSAKAVVTDNVATITATLPAKDQDDVQALREAGIHIQVPGFSGPVLYNRVTFPVVNKGGNMEMTLTWEVVF